MCARAHTQSTYICYKPGCSRVVWSYTIKDQAVTLLPPRRHAILKGNLVFGLHNIFHVHNSGIKCNLPVLAHLFATLQTLPV